MPLLSGLCRDASVARRDGPRRIILARARSTLLAPSHWLSSPRASCPPVGRPASPHPRGSGPIVPTSLSGRLLKQARRPPCRTSPFQQARCGPLPQTGKPGKSVRIPLDRWAKRGILNIVQQLRGVPDAGQENKKMARKAARRPICRCTGRSPRYCRPGPRPGTPSLFLPYG